jgi:hypothetical protein
MRREHGKKTYCMISPAILLAEVVYALTYGAVVHPATSVIAISGVCISMLSHGE